MINLRFPSRKENLRKLKAGDEITISGGVFTARDAAHKKLLELINAEKKLPFSLKNTLIYYTGPTPARPGQIIGAAGPTTSSRMDSFTPRLYQLGLNATLGKGPRHQEVAAACKKFGAVYLVTYGGLGAYLSKFIVKSKVLAFPELGPEAVYQLEIRDFPVRVAIDTRGRTIF